MALGGLERALGAPLGLDKRETKGYKRRCVLGGFPQGGGIFSLQSQRRPM